MNPITFTPQTIAQQHAILEFAEREKLEIHVETTCFCENHDDDEDDNFVLTPEMKRILDERLESVENGTAVFYTHEEVMTELDEYLVQLKEQRKTVYEYA